MEVMRARLTALEPNDLPLTTSSLLVVNCVKNFLINFIKNATFNGPLGLH